MTPEEQKKLDEEEAKKARDKSLLDTIGGFFKGIFSNFGTIFMIAAVAIGGYFLLGGDKAKDLLGGLMEKIPGWVGKINADWEEPVRDTLNGLRVMLGQKGALSDMLDKLSVEKAREKLADRVSPAVLSVITKDEPTWRKFVELAKAANGGSLTKPEDITSGSTIMKMLGDKDGKAIITELFTKLNPALNKNLTKADRDQWSQFIGAAKDIVSGKELISIIPGEKGVSLPQLLSTKASRLAVFQMLEKASIDDKTGKPILVAADLEKNLKTIGLIAADDKPTPRLYQGLNALMDNLEQGKVRDFKGVQASLLSAVDLKDKTVISNVLDQSMPQLNTMLGSAGNGALFRKELGDAKLAALLPTASTGNMDAIARELLNKDNIRNTKDFADKADMTSIPTNLRPQIEALRNMPKEELAAVVEKGGADLLFKLQAIFTQKGKATPDMDFVMLQLGKPSHVEIINQAGIHNVAALMRASAPEYKDQLSDHNFAVLLSTAKQLNAAAPDARAQQVTRSVFAACVDLIDKKTDRFEKLTPSQLQEFFSKAGNNAAMRTLLNGLTGLTGEEAVQVNALKKNWGKDLNEGIGEVLADKDGAEFMKKAILSQNEEPSSAPEWMKKFKLWAFDGGKINENSDFLINYQAEMAKAPPPPPPAKNTKAAPARQ